MASPRELAKKPVPVLWKTLNEKWQKTTSQMIGSRKRT
jgi:hypothetical protein